MPILTAQTVYSISFVTENVEEQKVEKAIVLAEDRHIKRELGTAMYNDIIANPANYADIQDDLDKAIAWFTTLELCDHIYTQIYNTGILQGSSDFGSSSVANIVREKQTDALQRASEYLQEVYKIMKATPSNYPLYDFNCKDNESAYQRNGGIMMHRKRINKDRDILNTTKDSY